MSAEELAVDIAEWLDENIDGEPAVLRTSPIQQTVAGYIFVVDFEDGTQFDITVEQRG